MTPQCPLCNNSSWIITEKNGLSGAERCQCARPKPPRPRPTQDEILARVASIAATELIPFFPQNPEAWILIAAEMEKYVKDFETLLKFGDLIIRHGTHRYEGVEWFRKVYCAYFTPADGVYPARGLEGSQQEVERLWALQEAGAREEQTGEYALLAGSGASRPALPEVRRIPEARRIR